MSILISSSPSTVKVLEAHGAKIIEESPMKYRVTFNENEEIVSKATVVEESKSGIKKVVDKTLKEIKREAKELKIPCFNWMKREELIEALALQKQVEGRDELLLMGLIEKARERYKEAWKKYKK